MNSHFTILVVSDDAVHRHVLTQTLSDGGFSAITLSSGGSAVEWLESSTPTVLLLDLVMAPNDSHWVLARVRAQPRLKELPVIVLTALQSDEELGRVFSSGADDYVRKPFLPAELVARIRNHARRREYAERLDGRARDQQTGLAPIRSSSHATEQSPSVPPEARLRAQIFQRHVDFFESAADGLVVIGRDGKVLLANPRAQEIIGSSPSELLGLSLERLLDPSEHERFRQLLQGFGDGVYPLGVDFLARRRGNRQLVVNVSASSVFHEDRAALLTLRDVTQERRAAIELTRTQRLLQCVIDGSIDGIVSADLRGTVLLFNRAASRIFGYPPEAVVGKLRVDKLYPPGVAREVMGRILDPSINGYGRLQDYRVDMLGSDGHPIQVQLSASLVVDNGRKIGSVGIFTDIRDKLRIQAELERAQDELRNHEKQAIVAELAGAAAHELNQPLTSVIGYAELLRRQLAESPQYLTALQIIANEAERMAEIVRKVGRITKYETKSYVGEAKILDLEKASSKRDEP